MAALLAATALAPAAAMEVSPHPLRLLGPAASSQSYVVPATCMLAQSQRCFAVASPNLALPRTSHAPLLCLRHMGKTVFESCACVGAGFLQ